MSGEVIAFGGLSTPTGAPDHQRHIQEYLSANPERDQLPERRDSRTTRPGAVPGSMDNALGEG